MSADTPRSEITPDGTFILDVPVTLPDVLDMLVVGGGPFGTAAAFRARELGLTTLVIDYDDLMKRVRDYAKEKLILPDFGGGDLMQFPDGGPLIRSLQFGPIDKDDMCRQWKGFYRTFNVPAHVGVEMTGLERDGDLWRVQAWNHNTRENRTYRARHVVLAFGRGVPRRLDIPGNVEGLAFGLTDAVKYVGQPVCVIGGGTSAAEAVIAISNAKCAASDPSSVYWSYRLERMPKVSKALADVFFQAFLGNGNVRYLPKSDAVAMIEADGEPYLTVRIARVTASDAPTQITLLEFRKLFCIACIGEEIPKALLAQIGIPLVTGGPANRERLAVTPLLETRQPHVYLAGDILSPAYFETTNFDADPARFQEVKRRGNIKAALRDGVTVAEVVAQKLAGRTVVEVQLQFVEGPEQPQAPAADVPRQPAAAPPQPAAAAPQPVEAAPQPAAAVSQPAAVPPQAAAAPAAQPAATVVRQPPAPASGPCRLVTVLPSGVDADEYRLKRAGATTLGRQGADIAFADDASLSDIHAEILAENEGRYVLVDKGGAQGVFVQPKPNRPVNVEPGTIVRAGRQWLVIGEARKARNLQHYDASGRRQGGYVLKDGPNLIGRQSPNITIAPDDTSLSRRHLLITVENGVTVLKDVGSANGTQIKVRGRFRLADGDCVLLGRQTLRFDDERIKAVPSSIIKATVTQLKPSMPQPKPTAPAEVPPAAVRAVPVARPAQQPVAAAPSPAVVATNGGPGVFFAGINRQIPCTRNQTICEIAERAGVPLKASCHQGLCGEDPVRVVSGTEHLNPIGSSERSTLEDLCSLEPGPYRLACMARVSGPVSVEIAKQR